jgi:hypothetical protein
MSAVYITPCKDYLLAELRTRASVGLNNAVKQTPWLKWTNKPDVNGRSCMQWYIVVDTTVDKEQRLIFFARLLKSEGYEASCRICPHDNYYEDYQKYFA